MKKKIVSKQKRKYGNYETKMNLRHEKKDKIIKIRELINNKKFNNALNAIESYVDKYGTDCYIIHEYGRFYFKNNDYNKSEKYFLKNVQNDEENKYYSMYELGRIAIYNIEYDKAISYFIEIINSTHPEKCHAILELSKIYIIRERYDDAEMLLLGIINHKSENYIYALEELIQLKIFTNKIEEAEVYLKELKEHDFSKKKHFFEAQLKIIKGDIEEGEQILKDLIDNNDFYNINAKIELAKLEYDRVNYNKALELIRSIENTIDYTDMECLVLSINIFLSLRMIEEAKERVDKLLNINEEYLDKALYFKGKIELLEYNFVKAYEYFEEVSNKRIKIYKSAKFKQICILIKQQKDEEAYKLFQEFEKLRIDNKFDNIANVMKIYFNKILHLNMEVNPIHYTGQMVLDYKKEVAIEHIKEHKIDNYNKKIHTLINDNIDIEELYEYAYNNINENNFVKNNFMDTYLLRYENVGYDENHTINYIKVVTLPNSKDIITIYPYDNINFYKEEYINKNNEEEIEKNKVKKYSQIEKFNRKYNIS